MLSIPEIAAVISATKGAIEIFDRIAGQIKSVLLDRPKEAEGADDRWRIKITGNDQGIIVNQNNHPIKIITRSQLGSMLSPNDLALVETYEKKMNEYFSYWRTVYSAKDSSPDPLVNAKVDNQLTGLISKMKIELLAILDFLENIGVQLDDHYMSIRMLVRQVQ